MSGFGVAGKGAGFKNTHCGFETSGGAPLQTLSRGLELGYLTFTTLSVKNAYCSPTIGGRWNDLQK
jgi:hypothetical protein